MDGWPARVTMRKNTSLSCNSIHKDKVLLKAEAFFFQIVRNLLIIFLSNVSIY